MNTQPKMLDRVSTTPTLGVPINNRPATYVEVAQTMNVERDCVRALSECAMAKISAAMVTLAYEQCQSVVAKWLARTDRRWYHEHEGRVPDLMEYLLWWRQCKRADVKHMEEKQRALAQRKAEQHRERVKKKRARVQMEAQREAKMLEAKRRRAERDAQAVVNRKARDIAKSRAIDLLNVVCEFMRADVARVVDKGHTASQVYVRQVYVVMARDTSYCGVAPSFPVLARIMGKQHACAFELHRGGKNNPDVWMQVALLCDKLGIAPPAYAEAKEGAA